MDCFDHPTIAAVAECTWCARAWCDPCSTRGVTAKICKSCGRRTTVPAIAGPGDLVGRLFSARSLAMACGLSVFGFVASFAGVGFGPGVLIVQLMFVGSVVGYYFNIIQHVGAGGGGMPGASDFVDDPMAMAGRALRGLLCFGVGMVPLLVWAFGARHDGGMGKDSITIGELLVLGQLYVPAVLLAVVFGNSALAALWPPAWWRVIARAPMAYLGFAVLWVVTVFVGGAVVGVLKEVLVETVPYVGFLISAMLSMLFCFAQAILVGQFLRRNAAAFGWD